MQDTFERTEEETTEIERHKYFLSEKVGYDVGWEHAVQDWDANHRDNFRADSCHGAPSGNGISMLFKRLFSRS